MQLPNLVVVDLPGIVGSSVAGEPLDLADRTRRLVSQYIQKEVCTTIHNAIRCCKDAAVLMRVICGNIIIPYSILIASDSLNLSHPAPVSSSLNLAAWHLILSLFLCSAWCCDDRLVQNCMVMVVCEGTASAVRNSTAFDLVLTGSTTTEGSRHQQSKARKAIGVLTKCDGCATESQLQRLRARAEGTARDAPELKYGYVVRGPIHFSMLFAIYTC